MELNKFLEQDINNFLDMEIQMRKSNLSKVREEEFQIFDLNKDYSKEIGQALDMDNVAKAKRTLHEVKDIYNKLEENTGAKQKAQRILEELYTKINKYVQTQDSSTSLTDEIKELQKIGLFKQGGLTKPENNITSEKEIKKSKSTTLAEQPIININFYGDKEKESKEKPYEFNQKELNAEESGLKEKITEEIDQFGKEIKTRQQAIETEEESINSQKTKTETNQQPTEEEIKNLKHRKAINKQLETLYHALKGKDITKAKQEYLNLKKLLDDFPFKNNEEREELVTDLFSISSRIKELEEYIQEKEQQQKKKKIEAIWSEIEDRKEKELHNLIKHAETLAKHKDFHKANFVYLDARHKLEKMKNQEKKSVLAEKLEKLKQKLLFEKISEKMQEEIDPIKKEITDIKMHRYTSKEKKARKHPDKELYKKGLEELYNGKREEAEKIFRKVLEINPNYFAAKIRLKQAEQKLGEA